MDPTAPPPPAPPPPPRRRPSGCWDGEWNLVEKGTQLEPGRYLYRGLGLGGMDVWGMLKVY